MPCKTRWLQLPKAAAAFRAAFFLAIAAPVWAQPPIAEWIEQARARGQSRVVIEPGVYRLAADARSNTHLLLRGLRNFEIVAEGVTLLFSDRRYNGFQFRDCRNVRFRGATVRYDPLPFTQGVVERVDAVSGTYDVAIDKGYPDDLNDGSYYSRGPVGYLFEKGRRVLKRGVEDLGSESVSRLGERRYRFAQANLAGAKPEPGDLIAYRGVGGHAFSLVNSSQIQLSGVTIQSAGVFAFFEIDSDGGNVYEDLKVTRGPAPPAATVEPLLSSNGDAFHSANVRVGPSISNSLFEYMGDDGIAIHGTFVFVMESNKEGLLVSGDQFRTGDPLRLIDPGGTPAGEAIVTRVTPARDARNPTSGAKSGRPGNSGGPYFLLRLDRSLRGGSGYLASNPSASGRGYVLRRNTIRFHRARGMMLKADNGLVESNRIEGSTIAGIRISPELLWNEAAYSRSVRIVENTLVDVGGIGAQTGGLIIGAFDAEHPSGCGHRGFRIENNRFFAVRGTPISIAFVCDFSLSENRFADSEP